MKEKTKSNKERQAEFKKRMREAGLKQITIWVPADRGEYFRNLAKKEASSDVKSS